MLEKTELNKTPDNIINTSVDTEDKIGTAQQTTADIRQQNSPNLRVNLRNLKLFQKVRKV